MEILAVALKNFKSHSDRFFEFQPGVNAICGENGAGKTSILEAIAWALFDCAGTYQKAELIRTGCPSAYVAVQIQSHFDGRSYEVQRCTSRGYEIYDPQLKAKLGIRRVDEVTLWLRQHLGVPAGTELAKLFADTIGIPQGTFTSDFLRSPDGRKKVFDPILKVEDYKQAFAHSYPLEKHAEEQVKDLERIRAQYELQLADWAGLRQDHATRSQEVQQDQAQLQSLTDQLSELETRRTQLQQQADRIELRQRQLDQRLAEIAAQQSSTSFLATALAQSEQAQELYQLHAPGYHAYEVASAKLQELEARWQDLQHLRQQREQEQQTLAAGQTQLIQLQTQLTALTQTQQQLRELAPLIASQLQLEQQLSTCQQQWQQLQTVRQQAQLAQQQLGQKQRKQAQLVTEIRQLEQLATQVETIPALEQQQQRYQQQLSHLQAARQFEAELTQLMARGQARQQAHHTRAQSTLAALQHLLVNKPTLAAVVQTIESGVQLNQDLLQELNQILGDLADQVDADQLQQKLATVQTQLKAAQKAQTEFAGLTTKQAQHQELEAELAALQTELQQAEIHLKQEVDLQTRQLHLQSELEQLADPCGQQRLYEQQLQQQPELQRQYDGHRQQQAKIEQRIRALEHQIAGFEHLAAALDEQKSLQQQHHTDYLTYLQQEQEAKRLPQLTLEYQQTVAKLAALKQQRETLETELRQLRAEHDPEAYQELVIHCATLRSQRDQLAGGLPPKQAYLAELEQQLQQRQHLAQERDQLLSELTRRQQLKQFVTDMRNVFNQSGPRISRFYLSSISQEADRLFRELLNRPDVALTWTEDYEIRVQESGHWRSFKSLSGGEQMCAALAVRLALLKILVDIDVAFFDEPTTNMDQVRRGQLAEALGNLKSFRQLFVISHDDTFENMTENIIRVEREA